MSETFLHFGLRANEDFKAAPFVKDALEQLDEADDEDYDDEDIV